MPCLQDSHLALYAWQQFLYFSQPPVDGFFLQYSSSLMPCLQDSHLALYAWQQLLSGGAVYFSQPGVPRKFLGFFLQNCSSLMPSAQERHLALYAWQQIGGPGCSILKA